MICCQVGFTFNAVNNQRIEGFAFRWSELNVRRKRRAAKTYDAGRLDSSNDFVGRGRFDIASFAALDFLRRSRMRLDIRNGRKLLMIFIPTDSVKQKRT